MTIDPILAKLVAWALGFLFTTLVAVLVWLAKSVMGKIDTIVKNQEADAVERTGMKKDIDSIKTDMNTVKAEIKDISDIKQKLVKIEVNESYILEDVTILKHSQGDVHKKITELNERLIKIER
jgi:hypothetical protein